MINLDTVAEFTWNYGNEFFLETSEGNYVWFDPDYQGNNTIVEFQGNYKLWCEVNNIPFGRDKGKHRIGDYCGNEVVFPK